MDEEFVDSTENEVEDTGAENQDETQDAGETPDWKAMQEQLQSITASHAQLLQSLKQPNAPATKKPMVSDEDLERFKGNPKALGEWLETTVSGFKNELIDERKKDTFDRKAYAEYPMLTSDKEFQKHVMAQMNEMVTQDNYSPQSPTLLYRASQIVAGKMNGKKAQDGGGQRRQQATSEAPSNGRTQRPTQKAADSDPRVQLGRLMGITDAKKLEAFKGSLGPRNTEGRKPRGRELTK